MNLPVGYSRSSLHFSGTAVPNGADVVIATENTVDDTPIQVASYLWQRWSTHMKSIQVPTISLTSITTKNGPDPNGPSADYATTAVAGTSSGTAAPPNVCFLATKNTNLGGRRGRGRMYVPGVSEEAIAVGGIMSGAFQTQFQTNLNGFLAGLATDGHPMVLLHGPEYVWVLVDGKPKRISTTPYIGPPSAVTSLTAQALVATQRRRLR